MCYERCNGPTIVGLHDLIGYITQKMLNKNMENVLGNIDNVYKPQCPTKIQPHTYIGLKYYAYWFYRNISFYYSLISYQKLFC